MDIAEFLLARIGEDEAVARECMAWVENAPSLNNCDTHHDPARVLAECDVKRQIVERESGQVEYDLSGEGHPTKRAGTWYLRVLALPYADHPDYDAEWKP